MGEEENEYTAENIFYVPAEARWETIAAQAHTPEIGTAIDNAMRAIERENRRLKDILPKNFARPELDKRRLGEVVDLCTIIRMHQHGDSKDILGRTYEYCLSRFAEAEGKLAGEFYTPACVVKPSCRCCNPSGAESTTPAAVRAGCSCSRRASSRATRATSTTSRFTARIRTPRRGRWRR